MARRRRPAGEVTAIVHRLLRKSPIPLSALALEAIIRDEGDVVPTGQIFRSLRDLIDRGDVRKILLARGYVATARGPEISLICRVCGSIARVVDGTTHDLLDRAARDHGFVPAAYVIEMSGLCATCAATAPHAPAN